MEHSGWYWTSKPTHSISRVCGLLERCEISTYVWPGFRSPSEAKRGCDSRMADLRWSVWHGGLVRPRPS